MTKMMKLCIGIAAFVAVTSAIRGDILAAAWAITAGLWVWGYAQADRRADAAEKHADNLASLLAAGAQVTVHRYFPVNPAHYPTLDGLIDAELHGHHPYSQGGIRPHLCVCGKPLAEHR